MVCIKALVVNTELIKQSSENSLITEVKVPVSFRDTSIADNWVGDTQEIKSLQILEGKRNPVNVGSGQIRKRKENSYAYHNLLSPKIRIALFEMSVS